MAKHFERRVIALIVCVAVLMCCVPVQQEAQALTGLDDLAIIAALLASLGISAVVYGATETMLDGLGAKLDAYGATQGMETGEFANTIVGYTSVRGPRILQLAKSGWKALMGFINYLKTEQGGGLSADSPIGSFTYSDVITIDGQQYECISAPDAVMRYSSQIGLQYMDSLVLGSAGYMVRLFGDVKQGVNVTFGSSVYNFRSNGSGAFYISDGVNGDETLVSAGRDTDFYVSAVNALGYLWLCYAYNDKSYNSIRYPYRQDYVRLGSDGVPVDTIREGWQISDDNFDLSYLNDAVSDIYIRLGSIAGDVDTLTGIAQGVVDAYDSSYAATGAGTVTATATTVDIGAAGDYATPELVDFFPFCIPFDLYRLVSSLTAEPEAPRIVIPLEIPLPGQETDLYELDERNEIVIDLSPFDDVARVLRTMEIVIFCIGLALVTRKVIKW